ncbi:MAG: hypothetical protein WCQ53_00295 [bacterium]
MIMILINFLMFSLFIFVSDSMAVIFKVRIERRIGVSANFIKMFFNTIPSYLSKIPYIIIVFLAAQIMYTNLLDPKNFIFLPLLMIFITTLRIDSKYYTQGITSASYFLSIAVCILTMQSNKGPFSIAALVVSMFAVLMINKSRPESNALSVATNLAINIYLIYVFMPTLPFVYSLAASFIILCAQSLLQQMYPKLGPLPSMRQSLTITLSASVVCFICNLLWGIFFKGGF